MSLWSRLFGKDPKELFLQFSPTPSIWRAMAWNFGPLAPKERQWLLEVHGPDKFTIEWKKRPHAEVAFYHEGKIIRKKRLTTHDNELKVLMNLAIHSSLKFGLEENQDFMVTPVSGATSEVFQDEARALQWLQTSFTVLNRALDKVGQDPSLVLTAAFFSGIEPETSQRVLRLVAFNLDIFYYLRPDYSLHIVVFDDKGLGHGESRGPTFQQIIKVTKPQFYDEIVKLVHRLAIVGEVS